MKGMMDSIRNSMRQVERERQKCLGNTENFGIGWTEIWLSSKVNSKIANNTISYTEMYPSG